MKCLGIETSCDETSIAIIEGQTLLHEALHTQIPVHAVFGGVVPEIASREHLRLLDALAQDIDAELLQSIDLIAVTRGPGLLGALLIGIAYAKALALALEIPVIGVHHLHAHLLACELNGQLIDYPAIGLLVSGGHTHLYLMRSAVDFTVLGKTLDDAAGEAFDKIAKLLNLPYPGGKYIDLLAAQGTAMKNILPKPYIHNDNCDFSFSGLKTAAAQFIRTHAIEALPYDTFDPAVVPDSIKDLCATLNMTIAETLCIKTDRAIHAHPEVRSLCVAGGVAANAHVRARCAQLANERGLKFFVPSQSYCGDNGAMVAYAGTQVARHGYISPLDFEAIPRGRHVPADYIVNHFFKE
ncbi:MAG: tRNA (adenosine(37)-N6)-threonylcarbamoyltransferase complex transferase subunit TsaD [Desulfovibrionales bacterium]|nr:tRNA (adenosine(37)-N6)-threonylcarbamoyltransferase complex transferase subunit TsaD [Desulfovibrionales bacterium]